MNPYFNIAVLITILSLIFATDANIGTKVFCVQANITTIRIQGCAKEPCRIKKGVRVPIEVDFSFVSPKVANDINFSVGAPYWNIPGEGAFGSNIAEGNSCTQLKLKSCPPVARRAYTLKSQIYADPNLQSTIGNLESTGKVRTGWLLSMSDLSGRNEGFAQCIFYVTIILTN